MEVCHGLIWHRKTSFQHNLEGSSFCKVLLPYALTSQACKKNIRKRSPVYALIYLPLEVSYCRPREPGDPRPAHCPGHPSQGHRVVIVTPLSQIHRFPLVSRGYHIHSYPRVTPSCLGQGYFPYSYLIFARTRYQCYGTIFVWLYW